MCFLHWYLKLIWPWVFYKIHIFVKHFLKMSYLNFFPLPTILTQLLTCHPRPKIRLLLHHPTVLLQGWQNQVGIVGIFSHKFHSTHTKLTKFSHPVFSSAVLQIESASFAHPIFSSFRHPCNG